MSEELQSNESVQATTEVPETNQAEDIYIPSDGEENNTPEGKEETSEVTKEKPGIEYPDFVPAEYRLPEKFEKDEEELEFYRKNYPGTFSLFDKPEYAENLADKYGDYLAREEENHKELLALRDALKGSHGVQLAKLYFPHLLEEEGVQSALTESEIDELVNDKMEEEFGSGYLDKYNDNDSVKAWTISGKIHLRKQQLYSEIGERIQNRQKSGMPEEQRVQKLNDEFEKEFKPKGFTKEQFDRFTADAKAKIENAKLIDYHKLVYFDKYMEQAKKKAYEEGRKSGRDEFHKEIKNAGAKTIKPVIEKENDDDARQYDPFRMYSKNTVKRNNN